MIYQGNNIRKQSDSKNQILLKLIHVKCVKCTFKTKLLRFFWQNMNAYDKFLPLQKFQGLNLPVLFCPEGFLVETIVS